MLLISNAILINRNNIITQVLGFNARQRKAFLNAIMRYGMPPQVSLIGFEISILLISTFE